MDFRSNNIKHFNCKKNIFDNDKQNIFGIFEKFKDKKKKILLEKKNPNNEYIIINNNSTEIKPEPEHKTIKLIKIPTKYNNNKSEMDKTQNNLNFPLIKPKFNNNNDNNNKNDSKIGMNSFQPLIKIKLKKNKI